MLCTSKNNQFFLLLSLDEIKREKLTGTCGGKYVDSDRILANAERIAEITFNPLIFEPGCLHGLEIIDLNLFDEIHYLIMIRKAAFTNNTISLRGIIENNSTAVFFLSLTGKQVLATLRLPGENLIYLLRYIQSAGKHYLFQAEITAVEQYECEVLIPPGE